MRERHDHPVAITMWDFSWLERRWPGAGYEDWDLALTELAERGYDAVRIDPYPHLVAADPEGTWDLLPWWNQQDWGAKSLVTVSPLPSLIEFMTAARREGIKVALSSWYREDRDNTRMSIRDPRMLGNIWLRTLEHVERAGLLDTVLYVDLCNEFCMPEFAQWMYSDHVLRRLMRRRPPTQVSPTALMEPQPSRTEPWVVAWMAESIGILRERWPDLLYTFSFCDELPSWPEQDVSALDLLEPHIWMSSNEYSDFDQRIGYGYEAFESTGYENLVANARRLYEEDQAHFDAALFRTIDTVADWSRATHLPLYTTECWAVTQWKDWPGLQWDWVMDINARAVEHAAATGRWAGIATSNHCGPQFVGMWREVEWHRRLTSLIKSTPMEEDLLPTPAPPGSHS